ncbi:MAG: type II toxin-antitoxin system RelE/ParE family toxin [Clostridia bacterium]|nr:type II toxin-antitoxin system RelE/ParE family toxin [Clostridia bacterium]MBR6028417.1 type II toxin-antitoxin system RelE/ParE family toxin [Clostridia bacterium]
MSCQLRWSPAALEDLDSIWSDVLEASGDVVTADRFVAGLREAVSGKKEFPMSGTPLLFMGVFTGIRYVRFKRYIAFCRVRGDVLEVSRVLFEASDYMKPLFGLPSGESTPDG